MSATEKLHFRIGLSGTYWDQTPKYSILVDGTCIKQEHVTVPSDETFYVEFDHELAEDSHNLIIRLENKTSADTVENQDKTAIVQDMLLNIVSIEIDEINIGNLIWTHSEFVGDDPARPVLNNCVNLGWNGSWTLPFNSPFYIWLLENI
jgi:hypothetical protein